MGSKKAKTAGTRLETEPVDVEDTPIKVRPHRVRSRSLLLSDDPFLTQQRLQDQKKRGIPTKATVTTSTHQVPP